MTTEEQPGEVVATEADSMTFAKLARAIEQVTTRMGLDSIRWRAPSFEDGRSWSGLRGSRGLRVGVNIRGRNAEAVAADMIEATLKAHARVDDMGLFRALDDATWFELHPEDRDR